MDREMYDELSRRTNQNGSGENQNGEYRNDTRILSSSRYRETHQRRVKEEE